MKVTPRYSIPPGSEITLLGRPMVVTGQGDQGYTVVGSEDGASTVVSYSKFVEHIRLPGASINTSQPVTGGHEKVRLGGFSTSMALSEEQRRIGRFRYALCEGVRAYRAWLRIDQGDPDLKLSQRMADRLEARKFIAKAAEPFFEEPILVGHRRGGAAKGMVIYKGRTLMELFEVYENLEPGVSPIDALVPLDHLKGNKNARICFLIRELMTEAWEQVGFDLRGKRVSNVRSFLETRIWEVNQKRERNELPKLIVPAYKTVAEHVNALLNPTELLVATKGRREARNKRGRGSTDLRALLIGELVEVDECKISLVTSAKVEGVWERMSKDDKEALERLDEYIRSRLWILVMVDVATRMPLAWVIAEKPNAEATLALFRMATRDKEREKHLYGCSGQPASAVGLMHVKNDNGPGLRNSKTVGALMGIGSTNSVTRTYSSTDRSVVERTFGTLEIDIFRMLPGYTGGRPGELPGYDAMANGVLTVEQLHEILTRYFIDEYPSIRHYGVGMHGRRPAEVYASINATRGHIAPIDPHVRRIRLGWEETVTPTDEGVRVFHGIYFNSDALQIQRDRIKGKVKVFVDPDNLNTASVILPGIKEPVEVQLQITAFADMTLPEVLKLMAEFRREDPNTREIHEDRIMRTRRDRYDRIKEIGLEHNLPRSYSTVAECREMARAVFSGARPIRSQPLAGTTRPGDITEIQPGDGVFHVGGGDTASDAPGEPGNATSEVGPSYSETSGILSPEGDQYAEAKQPNEPVKPRESKGKTSGTLARPKKLKGLN